MVLYISAVGEDGFCLDKDGKDLVVGQNDIDGIFSWAECFRSCTSNPAATACEWHSGGSCAYHTQKVSKGSGDPSFKCEKMGKHLVLNLSSYYAKFQH